MQSAPTRQFDLFTAPAPQKGGGEPARPKPAARPRLEAVPQPAAAPSSDLSSDLEAMARRIEASGDYRVLRRLRPRPVVAGWSPAARRDGERIGVILDTETTGLDAAADEIIELGMVMFTHDEKGIRDVVGVYSELRQPRQPIRPEITRITGITDDMVAGRTIDPEAVAAFVAPADLVIAHNARFDRPFCEAFAPGFADKAWACSVAEVDWAGLGFEGSKLAYLVGQCGFFHNGHRAVDDCHALLEVLAHGEAAGNDGFSRLVRSAAARRCRLYAVGSPFERKDLLKARGYRWNDGSDGRPKSWWIDVDEERHDAECAFLAEAVYGRKPGVVEHWLTAKDRYKA
ncbi:3'-5' exonuclease [Jiella sonneratiae]|uniref:3'-5' exonuclease n=1 Tax=Jiella sonneratiae TaxID=2816856 RepID=A0ABS3J562_9HYPH|nr:3'-5' exonuclease [Jiella sonneratiae]MBO0904818.1 3'-5' exonuclease [Jiella sonneratiae]